MNKEQQKKLIVEIMNDDSKDGMYEVNKKTAVEWLVDNINLKDTLKWELIVEEAKRIEKEQIIDAYKADLYPCSEEDAEQYYMEEYGKQ